MTQRTIHARDYRTMPWKNGGGLTREIAKDESSDPPAWRISIATIDRSGPFSHFTGYDRTMVPLSGVPFELHFRDHDTIVMRELYHSVSFRGEWETECRLLAGPAEDLNVMTLRSSLAHRVQILDVANEEVRLESDAIHFLYVWDGIAAGDTLWIQDEDRVRTDASRVCRITIAAP